MTSPAAEDSVPNTVADGEVLVRYCASNALNKRGVRWQAFSATKVPFHISVDRAAYCDPAARAAAEGRAMAFLVAGDVRARLPEVTVAPDKPPPEHAEIRLFAGHPIDPSTKDELRGLADLWSEHVAVCEKLAHLATSTRPER